MEILRCDLRALENFIIEGIFSERHYYDTGLDRTGVLKSTGGVRCEGVFVYHNKFVTRHETHSQSVSQGSEMDCKIVDLSVSDVR